MKTFKASCSNLWKIMSNDKSGKKMGETAKTYLKEWHLEQLSGKRDEFKSRYTEKGNECEDDAITMLNFERGTNYVKNEERFYNDYIHGEPDIVANKVIDIKNSYELKTHPIYETATEKKYVWQVLGYMWLTGVQIGEVVHTLLEPSDNIIEWEARTMAKATRQNWEDCIEDAREKLSAGTLPHHLRIKAFSVQWDEAAIEAIKTRVLECREYILELDKITSPKND